MRKMIILGMVMSIQSVFADLCQYNSKAVHERALKHLKVGREIYKYCQTCSDGYPEPIKINSIEVDIDSEIGDPLYMTRINGETEYTDFAHTFVFSKQVDGQTKKFENLGIKIDCLEGTGFQISRVSQFLTEKGIAGKDYPEIIMSPIIE